MRPAWRLAISNVFERRSRSLLLIAVVAMSAMLISAVGVALSSVRGAIEGRVTAVIGKADLQLKPTGRNGVFDAHILGIARQWPEIKAASGKLDSSIALRFARPTWRKGEDDNTWRRRLDTFAVSGMAVGLDPEADSSIRPITLLEGRLPRADDEIVLDREFARRLVQGHSNTLNVGVAMYFLQKDTAVEPREDLGPESVATEAEADKLNKQSAVRLNDLIQVIRLRKSPVTLKVVGFAAQPPLGGDPQSYLTLRALQQINGQEGKLSQVDLIARDAEASKLEALAERRKAELPRTVILQTSGKITSGLDQNLQTNQIAFVIVSTLAFLAASFIIMTGMSTGVTERLRELGVLRCLGASRAQLAGTQLLSGAMLGLTGAIIGVPLGLLGASFMVLYFKDRLNADVNIEVWRLLFAFLGASGAAVLGAAFPALQASRVAPLQALAARASAPKARTTAIIAFLGCLGVLTHLAIFTLITDGTVMFHSYLIAGLPGLLGGYFLLGVPAVLLTVWLLGPLLERLLRLPRHLLTRGIRATPYRFGFTAGAMMTGLGLMVAIWTQGGAALNDWIDKIRFPDAFVVGFNLSPESQKQLMEIRIEGKPVVLDTSSVAIQAVETDVFGLKGRTNLKTYFIAFEPASFLRMNRLEWIEGDPQTAILRIEEGGAVIVAREYLVAKGLGVGSTFTARDNRGNSHDFDIVGVVASPGLEIVADMFDVGAEFQDQRLHMVFGGRTDLKEKFGSEAIGLIQMDLADDFSDAVALQAVREGLLGSGVLNAGSGREIKADIVRFVRSAILVSSVVALFAMFVACLGVANLIIAGVQARQFEFGVLRAVGGSKGLLLRLVLAEAIVIALAACVLGILFGLQGAFGGARLNAVLWGVPIGVRPPLIPILAGCGAVFMACIGAALPTASALARKGPRELLAAMRG